VLCLVLYHPSIPLPDRMVSSMIERKKERKKEMHGHFVFHMQGRTTLP
jgi:hypothetical protein